jgi:hypothetical protein
VDLPPGPPWACLSSVPWSLLRRTGAAGGNSRGCGGTARPSGSNPAGPSPSPSGSRGVAPGASGGAYLYPAVAASAPVRLAWRFPPYAAAGDWPARSARALSTSARSSRRTTARGCESNQLSNHWTAPASTTFERLVNDQGRARADRSAPTTCPLKSCTNH